MIFFCFLFCLFVCVDTVFSSLLGLLSLKHPQFVDIPLEEDEDSSDEEYCPDEDEEDETAEDVRISLWTHFPHMSVFWL